MHRKNELVPDNSKLKDNEVLTKITRMIGCSAPPELRVLGATIGVSAQLLNPMQSAVERNGTGLLVLDRPDASTVPPLAAACTLAKEETCAIFVGLRRDADCMQKAEAGCTTIQKSEAFIGNSNAVELLPPKTGQ